MLRRPISASGVARFMLCPASAVLPLVSETSAPAQTGTLIHRYVAEELIHGPHKSLDDFPPELHDRLRKIDIGAMRQVLGDTKPLVEYAMAYSLLTDTCKPIGSNIDRKYEPLPGVIYGTADMIGVPPGVPPIVLDLKTGQYLGDVAKNWQLRTLAVGVSRLFDVDRVRVGLYYEHGDGAPVLHSAEFDSLDLDGFAADLRRLMVQIEIADGQVKTGHSPDVRPSEEACRWCGCVAACPAHTAIARAGIQAPASLTELTPELAGQSWEQLVAVERVVKRWRAELERYARTTPLPLSDGRFVREVPGYEHIDYITARNVLGGMYPPDVAASCESRSISKTGIKNALGALANTAIDAIRAAGGMVRGSMRIAAVKEGKDE